jgi:hypothetical protein
MKEFSLFLVILGKIEHDPQKIVGPDIRLLSGCCIMVKDRCRDFNHTFKDTLTRSIGADWWIHSTINTVKLGMKDYT